MSAAKTRQRITGKAYASQPQGLCVYYNLFPSDGGSVQSRQKRPFAPTLCTCLQRAPFFNLHPGPPGAIGGSDGRGGGRI